MALTEKRRKKLDRRLNNQEVQLLALLKFKDRVTHYSINLILGIGLVGFIGVLFIDQIRGQAVIHWSWLQVLAGVSSLIVLFIGVMLHSAMRKS